MRKVSERRVYVLRDENRFRLSPEFVRRYVGQQPAWGYGLLSYVTYKRTYARRVTQAQLEAESLRYFGVPLAVGSTQTSEEFWQTCVRVVEGVSSIIKQHVRDTGQTWSDDEEQHHAQEMFRRIWAFKFTPPGRGLWGMGTEALELKGSAILNNCGFESTEFLAADFADPFCTLMDYSMLGVGMGFDILGAGTITLQEPFHGVNKHTIPDTREGWIDAVRITLNAFVGKGELPGGWDFSKIRREGKPLKTFGGTASGPGPLKKLLAEVERLCRAEIGRPVSSTFIVDVMNVIGVCVVAGNVRRSSEIAIADAEDKEFQTLKDNTQLLRWLEEQDAIAKADHKWARLQRQITKIETDRAAANVGVLDPAYAGYQTAIDKRKASQKRRLKNLEAWVFVNRQVQEHPLMTHRWASNNTVVCKVGRTNYTPLVENTIRNGEPGYAWPEIFQAYGRLADPPNFKDKKAKGFNPCVVSDTRVLTRSGYAKIGELVGRHLEVWNGREWSWVTPKVTGVDEPIVRVLLSNGVQVDCTLYHKWILAPERAGASETLVAASELQVGDSLAKFTMPVVEGGSDWEEAYTHGFYCGDGQTAQSGSRGVLLYGVKKALLPFLAGAVPGNSDERDRQYVGLPRDLPPKFTVRHDLSVTARLNWLAGLLDAAGCALQNPNSVMLQLSSTELGFLNEVRLMLTTLGVQAKVAVEREAGPRSLPDGVGGSKDYFCQTGYRLLVNASDTYTLVRLGLKTHCLDLPAKKPQRDARRFDTVVSVTPHGTAAKVYCFNEPLAHRGTFEGVVTGQCGEQTLHARELCCLVELYPTKHTDLDDFLATIKYAYRYAKAVTLVPTHNQKTNAVMVRNRRIGTSMAGVAELYSKLGLAECVRWWDAGYKAICEWDAEYSGWLGVNESIKKTSIKPGGTTPLLVGVEGGLKLPTSAFYMRTIRLDHTSPLVAALREAGYRVEPDRTTPRTTVAYFPCKAPDGARLAADTTLWEQAAVFTALQRYWSDNMVSATLTFQPHEAQDITRVLQAYEGLWKCVSFLPLSTHGYLQAPYIPCTQEQYDQARAQLKPLSFDGLLVNHDSEDKFCSGGICEIPVAKD